MTGLIEADYTFRQAAYDLRKLQAKGLITKSGRSRPYFVPPAGARTISTLLTLRDPVIVFVWLASVAHVSDIRLTS